MIDPLKSSANNYENTPKNKNKKIIRPLEDLILEMSWKDDDRDSAVKAFDEIIKRFEGYLCMAARMALFRNSTYDPTDLKALVSNTFLLLYENAENLLHIETLENELKKENMIKSWLSTVVRREAAKINEALDYYHHKIQLKDFADRYKEPGENDDKEDEPVPETIKIETYDDEGTCSAEKINIVIIDGDEESLTSVEMVILTEVLNECTAREQEIILTYYDYLDGRKHLPREEIANLCLKFGILPDNLNHIKNRTFNKIKQKCLERMRIKNPDYRLRE